MCGIAGIIDFAGKPIEHAVLERACAAMRHRGPDDAGTIVEAAGPLAVGLASVRLAVVDPTPAGHQPFVYADGRYLLVYNGELYNFRELRSELRAEGLAFATETDTEVVAAALAAWGPGALRRFNGMFALCFVDRREGRGLLARDHFGIKPLLYAPGERRLFFASEMRTVEGLPGWERDLDESALPHYLAYGYFAAPQTIYARARRLEPGAFLAFEAKGSKHPQEYRDPPAAPVARTYGEACAAVRTTLARAVARQRVADVPLGTFLSGGIDSSIVALHLAECTPGPIETFALGHANQPRYDESSFARLVAQRLGSRHHELRVTWREVLGALPPLLDHQGEPFFDSSIVAASLVSQLARRHVTVSLSGDGGDELFGGYWRYLGHDALASYERLPRWLRRYVLEPLLARGKTARTNVRADRLRQLRKLLRARGGDAFDRHLAWSRILSPEAEAVMPAGSAEGLLHLALRGSFAALTKGMPADDHLNRILAFDLRHGLPDDMLHKVDLASMVHSLEVRVPFLDPDVVALAESCPSAFKVHRGLRKRLLVDAYRGHLPDEVLDRGKMGFEIPIGEFLRNELRSTFLDVVTPARLQRFPLVHPPSVRRVFDDHLARRGEHADLLFALLALCWWTPHR